MKIILIKDVKGLGKLGQIVEASDGHARNYLIPKGFAKEASSSNLKDLDKQRAEFENKRNVDLTIAKELCDRIEKAPITLKTKAGEGGRLFGAITSKDIADTLLQEYQIDIDKRKIVLDAPIKHVGNYILELKLHHDVTAKITLKIEV